MYDVRHTTYDVMYDVLEPIMSDGLWIMSDGLGMTEPFPQLYIVNCKL